MTMPSLHAYLPLSDLARIVVVVLAVAVVAPSAASVAIVGLDRRQAGSPKVGDTLVALGAGTLFLLVALGLYALLSR